MPDNAAILAALSEMQNSLRLMRKSQLQLARSVTSMRHEINHRLGTSREELGALVKASHVELSGRLDKLDTVFSDDYQRLTLLEQQLEALFGSGA